MDVPDADVQVQHDLKRVIQELYELELGLFNYEGPKTQQYLTDKLLALQDHFQTLHASAAHTKASVPPEIISYVELGRNPDIYTREFVELVQKSNMFLKGRCEAYGGFKHVLAKEMLDAGLADPSSVHAVLALRTDPNATDSHL